MAFIVGGKMANQNAVQCWACGAEDAPQGQFCALCRRPGQPITESQIRWVMSGSRRAAPGKRPVV